MAKPPSRDPIELVYGSLDMLILRTLLWWNTGHSILHCSACGRKAGLPLSGASPRTSMRAKYYRLTAAGRRQLVAETSRWERFVRAITGVLRPAESEEKP